MQRCAICERPMYGHPDVKGKTLVCGSCPLQKVSGARSGKGEFEIHLAMTKMARTAPQQIQENQMSELLVKSNFARNKVILLAGRYALAFDSHGEARMPAHLREALEVEQRAKPGRFWIVDAELTPIKVAPPAPAAVAEVKVEKVQEVPPELDLDYLVEEKKPAPVKAAKKK